MKKDRLGVVYSTDPDFQYQHERTHEQETLPPQKQDLKVSLDKKNRAGKAVTLVENFIGKTADLETLGKMLRNKCGTGGAVKDGAIIIQGDQRTKVAEILAKEGYRVKVR